MRLELTRRTDYAVRAMLVLAHNPTETLSSVEISERTNIPVRFVTQVMSNLVRDGLVSAVIGRSGGYRLNAAPESVSVLSIVEAVEGDLRRQHCALRGGQCERQTPCAIHHVLAAAQEAFIDELGASSLSTVMDFAGASRSSRDASPGKPPPARDAGD